MWHVSLAYLQLRRAVYVAVWKPDVVVGFRRMVKRVLARVGGKKEYEDTGEIAMHYRRQLGPEEVLVAQAARPGAAVFQIGGKK